MRRLQRESKSSALKTLLGQTSLDERKRNLGRSNSRRSIYCQMIEYVIVELWQIDIAGFLRDKFEFDEFDLLPDC